MAIERGIREQFDWGLFVVVCVIATIGVVNLYSATSSLAGARGELYVQQIYWLSLGAGVAVIVAAIDYKYYERYAYVGSSRASSRSSRSSCSARASEERTVGSRSAAFSFSRRTS